MIHEINSFPRDDLPGFAKEFLTEDMLLFDIETTGLSPARDTVYCIGCGYLQEGNVRVELFFAQNPDEEAEVLEAFFALAETHPVWITFNGTTFDLPFLRNRASAASQAAAFPETGSHIDLYREARALRDLLELPSYRQKSIERFLGIDREDIYTGGELIEFYKRYSNDPDPDLLEPILLHNREDVIGMFDLLGIMAYGQFRDGKFSVEDMTEEDGGVLSVKLRPKMPLPQSIHRISENAGSCAESSGGGTGGGSIDNGDGISFLLGREAALVRIPIRHGELKYFFDDPENYYYLPDEDTAVHKSVGQFVDPSHRVRASKKNCYARKECDYLALPCPCVGSLRRDYEDTGICIEFPADENSLKAAISGYFSLFT